jgi:hypothetical protein
LFFVLVKTGRVFVAFFIARRFAPIIDGTLQSDSCADVGRGGSLQQSLPSPLQVAL